MILLAAPWSRMGSVASRSVMSCVSVLADFVGLVEAPLIAGASLKEDGLGVGSGGPSR